ncbi:uncharacterized protein TEOVI_000801700 [Trypanosoma equiperdum]|uniref:Spermidine synthase n=2 Tax=Trypanozoon TaxID=39700 RepID=Q57X26_TRYB2|nr:hypothetical protein, conserved [Trypanosoma brucei brucei TREU927]AAX69841.1 hypothetical protein, conserved [Trypanosoma brucei]AAZ13320.1 hypothetical protein, conserved [Trypanosoma brucei brucei TREU927]SCU67193.1 hypothetical protein, conserved [Trypanosoma equiperdum]
MAFATSPGQRPQKQYINKFTAFFFREVDRGFSSPYVVFSTGTVLALAGWKFFKRRVEPERQINAVLRQPRSRVPLSDAHNVFWGFRTNSGTDNTSPRSLGEAMSEDMEEALRRPRLLHSEPSELQDSRTESSGGTQANVACMELQEYDPQYGDDVVFRSVHYIYSERDGSTSQVDNKTEEVVEKGEDSSYLSRMPGHGLSVIHGMVKCKFVTAQNNCVPYAGHLESEYARKMMLALGPVHILRDIARTSFPIRFTTVKETPVSTLVCGLHSGEAPRWLSNAFPNFQIDVVERDGALVRVCRRFMGLQESSNLRLFIADPVDFLRRNALVDVSSGKRYDLIMIDTLDGAGRLSTQYGRLEFINSVRNSLSPAGCVVAALPNRDAAFLYHMVQNWRLAFAGRTVLLVHCVTSPHTMLITFQDDAERGRANFGSVGGVDEFKDLLRTKISHYGVKRIPFDLPAEVSRDNFRVLHPGKTYQMDAYLPSGHPQLRSIAEGNFVFGGASNGGSWTEWLRRLGGSWLTPTQRTDLKWMEK